MKLSEGVLTSCMAVCARYIISSCYFLVQICRAHTSKKYTYKITENTQGDAYDASLMEGIFVKN